MAAHGPEEPRHVARTGAPSDAVKVEITTKALDSLIGQGYTDDQIAHVIAMSLLSGLTDGQPPSDIARDMADDPDGETARQYANLRQAAANAVQAGKRRN